MKSKLSSVIAFLIAAVLCLSPFATLTAFAQAAEQNVAYIDVDGSTQAVQKCTVITADTTYWNSGWYAVTANTKIDSRVTVSGNVNLILCDGAVLTVPLGIDVAGDDSFTIWGQANNSGTLYAGTTNGTDTTCQFESAGIGGGSNGSGGAVTITGGTVTAKGGSSGAGIGGGESGNGGDVTIIGGTVTASPDSGAAAIGHGKGSTNGSLTLGNDDVHIKAGTVINQDISYVNADDRISACQNSGTVHTEPCIEHS